MHIYQINQENELRVLRQVCSPVVDITDEILTQITEMHQMMIDANGVGLAANQVGLTQRFFVINMDGETPLTFINPVLTFTSNEQSKGEEGCLSIPQKRRKVVRAEEIEIQALNEKGRAFNLRASGLFAVCIQHELDHLNGKLFIDYLTEKERVKILKSLKMVDAL